jgi:hypothetical protein
MGLVGPGCGFGLVGPGPGGVVPGDVGCGMILPSHRDALMSSETARLIYDAVVALQLSRIGMSRCPPA